MINLQENNKSENGPHAQREALISSAEKQRAVALKRLGKKIKELHDAVHTKSNIHKEIKTMTTTVTTALEWFIELDEKWLAGQKRFDEAKPENSGESIVVPIEDTDTGADADNESVAGENRLSDTRKNNKRVRQSPDPVDTQVKKKLDVKKSPPSKPAAPDAEKKQATPWKVVQSKEDLKRQKKEQLRKEQPTKKPRPEAKRKKPRKWTRPDAIIVRPVEKEKYADILRRIKTDVKDDQASSFVEKISKTQSGNMLITLSKKSTDKGQALQKAIAGILKEDAQVICKGPQEIIEIHDIDDITTKDDILEALRKKADDAYEIPLEAIKIRKAYRGTQIATATLPVATAQKLLEGDSKIRIGWVNCRIKTTKRPTQCFKCWHFGHHGFQCKSKVNRSNLCIRCGQEGHRIADCKNSAKCALCAEKGSAENVAHNAGNHKCPVFQEALQRMTSKRT